MSAGAAIISDDEHDECQVVLFVIHRHVESAFYILHVMKDDLSFKKIRDEIERDGIPLQNPFRFTIDLDGEPVSAEQEENWSDWSVFKGALQNEYYMHIEEIKNCLVAISISGRNRRGVVALPRGDVSFERIRHEIAEDEIPVPNPFRFTLGAGDRPLSKEEEDNWSDWSIFAKPENSPGRGARRCTWSSSSLLYSKTGDSVGDELDEAATANGRSPAITITPY